MDNYDTERLLQIKAARALQAKASTGERITEQTSDFLLSTTWQKIMYADSSRIGLEIENQDSAAVIRFATGSAPIRDTEARAVWPSMVRMIDTKTAQDAIYAKSDTASIYVTITTKRGVRS